MTQGICPTCKQPIDAIELTEQKNYLESEIPNILQEIFDKNISEYEDLIASKGTHVIYIGRETCSFCAMFIPVMEEAQEKYGFKTNYLDISSIFDFTNNS